MVDYHRIYFGLTPFINCFIGFDTVKFFEIIPDIFIVRLIEYLNQGYFIIQTTLGLETTL